ncbi:hypothetical protein FAI40_03345 [Acetobacteraceae bacterium]|nr:hypothetical protein FAI40_03345 [Acetobacteraceae bacterium]
MPVFSRKFNFYACLPALLLLIFAYLIRLPTFGNPILHIDEDWYLYVGGKLLHGYLPYVDIWDRKPLGLFLLYAPFSLFGEHRFLAYQLTALFFAWGTALFILKITQNFISYSAGIFSACLYLLLLNDLGGYGGQTPVFYNFFTAFAFYLVLERLEEIKINRLSLTITGAQAMFLLGLAIQIKPTVLFEGTFLGCLLVFICWRTQRNIFSLLTNAVLWPFIALLPTLLVMGFYAHIGHFQEWYFATIESAFLRQSIENPAEAFKLFILLGITLSLWLIVLFTSWRQFLIKEREYFIILTLWLTAAIVAILLIHPYHPVYTLPLALPFALLAGFLAMKSDLLGQILMMMLFLLVASEMFRSLPPLLSGHSREQYQKLQKIAKDHPGCLLEYGGIVTMLDLTPEMSKNCHLTKYLFPAHLSAPNEEGAIGVADAGEELHRILDEKPEMILVGGDYFEETSPYRNFRFLKRQNHIMRKALKENYHLFYTHKENERFELYLRNEAPQTSSQLPQPPQASQLPPAPKTSQAPNADVHATEQSFPLN